MSGQNMGSKAPLRLLPMLLIGLAACSDQGDRPASKADTATAAATSAPVDDALSPRVASMSVDQLRNAAAQALRDNRVYAPAGANAVEYYLALRDKQPGDASVSSALTDLLPYPLIAAEQSIARAEFTEAQRLIALIERVDARAPALPRLKAELARGIQGVAARGAEQSEDVDRQAQRRTQPTQQPARQGGARQQAAAATPDAAKPATTPPPSLRPVSTPSPRYPLEALRAGIGGEVLVEITVGTDGSVTAARVLQANPARVFDRESLNAIKRWKFEPVAAPVTTRRTLSFNPGD